MLPIVTTCAPPVSSASEFSPFFDCRPQLLCFYLPNARFSNCLAGLSSYLCADFSYCGQYFLPRRDSYASIRPGMSGGGNASRSMRSRIAANNLRVTATSASWNVTYFACRVTFAPILTSFSRSVVSDQCFTSRGSANRRKKFARL